VSKSKVTLNADAISDKWKRRLTGSVQDIQAGIDAVSESPMEKAASREQKMLQGITQAVGSGRWAASLRKVNLQDWKAKTKQKVAERLTGGVEAAMPKRKAFDAYLVGTINQVLPEINSMPDLTFEDSVNRARRMMEHMHNNPYKK